MEHKQFFRLCHTCNSLNESEQEILKCGQCGKGFLSLNYFEKIRAKQAGLALGSVDEPAFSVGNPLYGLLVFW
jgi:hypothetical protein